MSAPSTKQRYSIHIVLSQRINHNESYLDLGKLLVAIAPHVSLTEFIAAAKKKIDKKYAKKYALNYEEQQGLQLFVRPKQDEDIKAMKHKWSEIVDFDEALNDYIVQPNEEVIVLLFTEPKSSSPLPVPLAPVPPPSAALVPRKIPRKPVRNPMNISKMSYHYTTIKNAVNAQFYKIRVRYFEHDSFRINEMVKEFPPNVTIGDVKKELSCICGIHARLQYKPVPNIIDSAKCICFMVKLQSQMMKPQKKASDFKSIQCKDDNDLCHICRNKMKELCIECVSDSIADNKSKADCINTGSTLCEHVYHLHCIQRWLKTRDSCPLDNKSWTFQTNKDPQLSNDNDNQANNAQSVHFYYKRLNGGTPQHILLNNKQHGIDFKSMTVHDLCAKVSSIVSGLTLNDKRLFANQVDVTFKKRLKLYQVGFDGNNNIFHICGRKKHAHSLTICVNHVKIVSMRGNNNIDDDDDDKKQDPQAMNVDDDDASQAQIITYGTQTMEGVQSSLSMKELKKKIELIMDIPQDKQTLYQLVNKDYELIENDTQIAEIGGALKERVEVFVEVDTSVIDCTFDMFCNGYLLPSNAHKRPLFDIFSPFDDNLSVANGSNILYCCPRWLYRKGAFIKKSMLNSEELYHASTEQSTLPDALRLSAAWIPYIPQTRKGMTSFLSCLYVITQNNISNKRGVLCCIRSLTLNKFGPLLLSFKVLLDRRLLQLTEHHKAALTNGFYYLFRNLVPKKVCADDSKVFQYSHILFSYILGEAKQYDVKYKQYEKYKVKQLTDPITNLRLIDPVIIPAVKKEQLKVVTLRLFVKRLTGKTIVIEGIQSDDKILKLQTMIEAKENIEPKKQKLIFAGAELKANQILSQCKLVNESTLHLVERISIDSDEEDEDEEEEEVLIYSRQTVKDQAQFQDIAPSEIVAAKETALLLESYSESTEIFVWDWKHLKECIDYKCGDDITNNNDDDDDDNKQADDSSTNLLRRLNISWINITSAIGNNENNKIMKIIPTLSLKNLSSSSTVLTLDRNGNLCALCGAVKNDGNNRQFYLPLYRDIYSVDLDELALHIKNLNLNIDADSWVDIDDSDAIDDRQPLEAIVVCFDRSYSMQESCFVESEDEEDINIVDISDDDAMSRLDVVKCYWSAFLNRSKAYDYANHIGLIVFDSQVETTCFLSPLYERFRKKVEEIQVRGCTALRNAMKEAAKQLVDWKLRDHQKRKDCGLRIIALTDGEDNQSSISDVNLTQILLRHNITADAIMIGNHNHSLHAICSATGGYVFYPLTFRDGLRIFELETFLSTTERADASDRKSTAFIYSQQQLNKYGETEVDICDENHVPKGKIINNLQEKKATVSLQTMVNKKKMDTNKGAMQAYGGYNAKLRTRKVIREMSDIMKDPHPFWDIYVQDDDIFFWKLVLCGAADTPYSGGIFLLYLEFSDNYPDRAPKMRFITPIKHVNVNSYGRICHSIFGRNYNPDTKIRDILNNVYGLLLHPDWDDPLDSVLRQEYADDKDLFRIAVAKHVKTHAMKKSRKDWKNELAGDANKDEEQANDGNQAWIPHNKDNQMDDNIV